MKKHLLIFTFLIAVLPFYVTAQTDREDVIYLKNGTIYRGTIVEQVPFVSYKIEIFGGTIIDIAASDVVKVTKEEKLYIANKPKPIFHYRQKGYIIQGEINAGLEEGFSISSGYKFGQLGMLSIGFGVNKIFAPNVYSRLSYCEGGYLPVFIVYGGDILKKKTTPFYRVRAGYSYCFKIPDESEGGISGETIVTTKVQGGPMGGVELGVRFYTRHQVNITLGANLTIQSAIYWNNTFSSGIGNYIPTPGGGYYTTNTSQTYSSGAVVMYIPTFNFGIGF